MSRRQGSSNELPRKPGKLAALGADAAPSQGALGEPKLVRTAGELAHRWSGVAELPPMESIEELATRLRTALVGGRPDQVSDRDWTLAAFALWHGEVPLAAEPRFLDPYLSRLDQRRRRREVSSLISAYLRAFVADLPSVRQVAACLHVWF